MKNGAFFLWRLINSITEQEFKDWELIITKEGKMAENTNAGMKRARGEYIKIMYMDDWFTNKNALGSFVQMLDSLKDTHWVISATNTNPNPKWTDDIHTGNNKLGSPSALFMRNGLDLYFDENMSWLLDCDLYKRMYSKCGAPYITSDINIGIGLHEGQMTNILTEEDKLQEHFYIKEKYE